MSDYDTKVPVLTDPEAVRKRPGMYIGDPHDGSGLAQMLWELLGNSVDQFLSGRVRTIEVKITEDNVLSIWDDGLGIDDEAHAKDGLTTTDIVMTTLHYEATAFGHSPHWHVGYHGIGLAAVCALSDRLEVIWHTADGKFEQHFARGQRITARTRVGSAFRLGFEIRLLPDFEIFTCAWPRAFVQKRLEDTAFLLEGLNLRLNGQALDADNAGLEGLLRARPFDAPHCTPFSLESIEGDDNEVRVCLGLTERTGGLYSFCNLEVTTDGTHHEGFARGLKRAFHNAELAQYNTPEMRSLVAAVGGVVAAQCRSPKYRSPTRDLLNVPAVGTLTAEATERAIGRLIVQHRQLFLSVLASPS